MNRNQKLWLLGILLVAWVLALVAAFRQPKLELSAPVPAGSRPAGYENADADHMLQRLKD